MKNQEVVATTVQEVWLGQTAQADSNDKKEKVVVKECSCLFD